jgi:putative hydrolase of the HAD superfamily
MKEHTSFEILLFDLGGVLTDFAGFDELRRVLPGTPHRHEVRNLWIESVSVQQFERGRITTQEFARSVICELELDISPDDFIADFKTWARGPYPGARSTLAKLRLTHRLACLSNSNELHTPLHRRSVAPLMDEYFFSNELGEVKPSREVYDLVIQELNTSPDRIAFFDDTPVNVEAAKSVGLCAFQVEGLEELSVLLERLGVLCP